MIQRLALRYYSRLRSAQARQSRASRDREALPRVVRALLVWRKKMALRHGHDRRARQHLASRRRPRAREQALVVGRLHPLVRSDKPSLPPISRLSNPSRLTLLTSGRRRQVGLAAPRRSEARSRAVRLLEPRKHLPRSQESLRKPRDHAARPRSAVLSRAVALQGPVRLLSKEPTSPRRLEDHAARRRSEVRLEAVDLLATTAADAPDRRAQRSLGGHRGLRAHRLHLLQKARPLMCRRALLDSSNAVCGRSRRALSNGSRTSSC